MHRYTNIYRYCAESNENNKAEKIFILKLFDVYKIVLTF